MVLCICQCTLAENICYCTVALVPRPYHSISILHTISILPGGGESLSREATCIARANSPKKVFNMLVDVISTVMCKVLATSNTPSPGQFPEVGWLHSYLLQLPAAPWHQ